MTTFTSQWMWYVCVKEPPIFAWLSWPTILVMPASSLSWELVAISRTSSPLATMSVKAKDHGLHRASVLLLAFFPPKGLENLCMLWAVSRSQQIWLLQVREEKQRGEIELLLWGLLPQTRISDKTNLVYCWKYINRCYLENFKIAIKGYQIKNIRQSCQLSHIKRETHAFRWFLTLLRHTSD